VFLEQRNKKMINETERMFRIYCKTRRGKDFDKYRKIRNRDNAAIRKKSEEEERKCQVFKTKKKTFYGCDKSKQKITSKNLRVRSVNGTISKTEVETAEELSKFFKLIYIQEDDCQIPDFHPTGLLKPPDQDKMLLTKKTFTNSCVLWMKTKARVQITLHSPCRIEEYGWSVDLPVNNIVSQITANWKFTERLTAGKR